MTDIHPLKAYRKTQTPTLSQEQLARELGVSRLTVTRWETGERKIGASSLSTVTEKTGIPAKELRPDLDKLFGEAAQ